MKTGRVRSWVGGMSVMLILSFPVGLWSDGGTDPRSDRGIDHETSPGEPGKKLGSVTGTVARIDRMEGNNLISHRGMHVTLRLENKEGVRVHLCPCDELELKGMHIRKNDHLHVRGVFADVCGNQELIAREITKNGKTIQLKDKTHPLESTKTEIDIDPKDESLPH